MLGECCNHRALRQEREQDCFLLPLFYEPSLETRFLLPADTTKLQTVWGQPSCSLQQIILWSIFLKHQPAVDTDSITDHMRWEPQFWVMLRCIFFHRTVFHTAMLWPWSGTEADLQKHRGQQRGHWWVDTCKLASHGEQKAWGSCSCSPHSLTPSTLTPGLALGAEAHRSFALNDGSLSTGLQKNKASVNLAVFCPYSPFYW